ncbi:MAG: sensor domain-containing diguanylate cyclase [Candidatus Omnitrophica bacterium]|nr:sensor domain-containing diguanylate cyclase [Candidatus Omnitrophota bacterium]
MERVNAQWELKDLAEILLDSLFKLVAKKRGNCILYLVNPRTHRLNIFATHKETPETIIKAKEGDLFDLWVVRHTASLLVENVKSDFRFDPEVVEKQTLRPLSSLISSPLLSQERLLGLIRMESPQESFYTQDDLRLLDTIANFTAVAIENTKLLQELKELAIRDSLTSCFTKDYFMERLKEDFSKNIKIGLPISLLMLDIDYFKKYNDKFGHVAGDIVLRELGKLLNEFIDEKGMVFRFGGEEFCILLPGTDKKDALKIAWQIIYKVEKKDILLRRDKTSITVSIGIACAPEDALLEDELVFKADQCLYQAKQKGRNRVCYI